jgi:hypothetical protein
MRHGKAFPILLIAALAIGLALGDDLDFTDDFPAASEVPLKVRPARKSARGPAAVPAPESVEEKMDSNWMYWTLGALGFTAVAGGAAWYVHSVSEDKPAPLRNDQVFSDAP